MTIAQRHSWCWAFVHFLMDRVRPTPVNPADGEIIMVLPVIILAVAWLVLAFFFTIACVRDDL